MSDRKSARRPRGTTGAQLLKRRIPQPREVVPGLLTVGTSLLCGKAKLGKSWMALELAVAVATGTKAMGSIPVGPKDALYLALEDNHRRLKSRLETVCHDRPPPERLHLFVEWPRLDCGGLEALQQWCTVDRPETRLIIVDTLAKVRPLDAKSTYHNDYNLLSGLTQLAHKNKLSLVIVHHLIKRSNADWMDDIQGSVGLSAAVDTVMHLSRARGDGDTAAESTPPVGADSLRGTTAIVGLSRGGPQGYRCGSTSESGEICYRGVAPLDGF